MNHYIPGKIIAITGPTASGKTARAVSLAKHFNGEIISADSRQVYKGMDIGTGKDLPEYENIPYHLIDIVNAGYKYNLYEFVRDANNAMSDIWGRKRLPILCGGTGLYLETLLNSTNLPEVPANMELRESLKEKSLDDLKNILSSMKTLHNTTDIDTAKRAIRAIEIQTYYNDHPSENGGMKGDSLDALIIGIDITREGRRNRITQRLNSRLSHGMIEEVKNLLDSGISPEDLIYYGLEYKFITLYLIGKLTLNDMINNLEIAIHQFAKRQMTWFRGMERRGHKIHWLPFDMQEEDFIESVKTLYYES